MKKKLITMAVAAAMAAPAAAMAEAIMYGKLHVSIDYSDVTNGYSTPIFRQDGVKVVDGIDFNGWGVNGRGYYAAGPGAYGNKAFGVPNPQGRANRIGVKGSEDLGNGLKAIYQVELGVSLADTNNNVVSGGDSITMRNSFVGLAGSFGSVLVGRHDTPLKISTGKLDMFADTMADYNGTVGFEDLRADNAMAYISPSFSGFQFMGALVAPGGSTSGSTYTLDENGNPPPPAVLGAGGNTNVNSDQLNGAYSLAAIYSNGPYYASLAYESLGNELFMDSAESLRPSYCRTPNNGYSPSCATVGDDYNKWRFGLGVLDWNGFTVSVVYEDQEDVPAGQVWGNYDPTDTFPRGLDSQNTPIYDGINSQELWQIQAGYSFGNNQVKAMYGQAMRDYSWNKNARWTPEQVNELKARDGDRSTWALAFDHNFSKRTKAYVLYTDVDDDLEDYVAGSSWSGFSLGMIHSF